MTLIVRRQDGRPQCVVVPPGMCPCQLDTDQNRHKCHSDNTETERRTTSDRDGELVAS